MLVGVLKEKDYISMLQNLHTALDSHPVPSLPQAPIPPALGSPHLAQPSPPPLRAAGATGANRRTEQAVELSVFSVVQLPTLQEH